MDGVSFVVPVHNGAAWLRRTLAAILAQADGRPMEVIVVDDRSEDGSAALLRRLALEWPLRILDGEGRGAAAAINTGVRAARFPIVCQVDQDVQLKPGWMPRLVPGSLRAVAAAGSPALSEAASSTSAAMRHPAGVGVPRQNGRASCRERVCNDV